MTTEKKPIHALIAAYHAEQQERQAEAAAGNLLPWETINPLAIVMVEGHCEGDVYQPMLDAFVVEWSKLPATRELAEALALMTVEQRQDIFKTE
jgi:hypothetical protein